MFAFPHARMFERTCHIETPQEERLNSLTHALGALLSAIALAVLVTLAALRGETRHVITLTIYGVSLLGLYLASACYHACREGRAKYWLQVVDHAAIYCLIAGTYTPFLLVSVRGAWGWSLFAILWSLAIVGTLFKFFFVGRFDVISTVIYIVMGWIGLVAAGPLLQSLPGGAIAWILAGGFVYTLGVVFYLWDHLPFNHAIWHLFVLGGSTCHFLAILFYVVPAD